MLEIYFCRVVCFYLVLVADVYDVTLCCRFVYLNVIVTV